MFYRIQDSKVLSYHIFSSTFFLHLHFNAVLSSFNIEEGIEVSGVLVTQAMMCKCFRIFNL